MPSMNQPADRDEKSFAAAAYGPIAFSESDWSWFCERVRVLELLEEDRLAALRPVAEGWYGHLKGVNEWLNLTRIIEPKEYLKWHLLDSLTLLPDRRLKHLKSGTPGLDLGSGGGYPGLPMAWAHPDVPWILLDSRQRKVNFLQEALVGLPGEHEARCFRAREVARAAPDLRRNCQIVVSRAAAAVDRLLVECAQLLARHGHLVAAKGPKYLAEEHDAALAQAKKLGYRFVSKHSVQLEDGDPERLLVVFERTT